MSDLAERMRMVASTMPADGARAAHCLEAAGEIEHLRAKIQHLIARLTRDAAERQHQYKHGSSMSTMREDMAEGKVAQVLRAVVSDLESILGINEQSNSRGE